MLIQCTKKLLDELKIKPDKPTEENLLFSWHANLITINRRKTVVLVNDKNRYIIVLYGLKAKNFKNMDNVITEAIYRTFREECIKEDIIKQYIDFAGEITYAKTKDKSMVAKMVNSCDSVQFYARWLDSNSMYQSALSMRASNDLVDKGKDGDYIRPHEEMYKDLESFAGKPIFSCEAAVLKVTLALEQYEVWRKIVIPLNKTFYQLHKALQAVFWWQDSHLHEFYIYDGKEPILNLVCSEEAFDYPDEEVELRHERGIRLSEYIPAYNKIKYNYDFGDGWEHNIELEKVIDNYNANYPVCFEGEGNAPPEDVGGEGGFEIFLEIIADKDHPEHEAMISWSKMQGYEDFDIKKVNRVMKFTTR